MYWPFSESVQRGGSPGPTCRCCRQCRRIQGRRSRRRNRWRCWSACWPDWWPFQTKAWSGNHFRIPPILMCSSLLMQPPGLLTVNRDSRRNVELVTRRRSGTWPRLVQNIVTSGVALARPFWRLPQVWCHGPIFVRYPAAWEGVHQSDCRAIWRAVPIYVLPALCWLSGLGLRPPLLLRWSPDLMKSSDMAMAEDLVLTGKILTTELWKPIGLASLLSYFARRDGIPTGYDRSVSGGTREDRSSLRARASPREFVRKHNARGTEMF